LFDILGGDRLEETRRNMERLIEGTSNLIKEMRELTRALEAHRRTMRELLNAIERAQR